MYRDPFDAEQLAERERLMKQARAFPTTNTVDLLCEELRRQIAHLEAQRAAAVFGAAREALVRERDEALRVRDLAREASNRDLLRRQDLEAKLTAMSEPVANLEREAAETEASDPLALETRAAAWVEARIGRESLAPRERAMRLLEEAAELAQSEGISFERSVRQVRHVYDRPSGDPYQEAGGVAVCLLAWCGSRAVRFADVAGKELARIEAKPVEEIRGSLARKADADLVTFVEHAE